MSRLGNHRVRPALSNAGRIKALQARMKDARRIGNMVVVEKLRTEIAWLTVNSLTE